MSRSGRSQASHLCGAARFPVHRPARHHRAHRRAGVLPADPFATRYREGSGDEREHADHEDLGMGVELDDRLAPGLRRPRRVGSQPVSSALPAARPTRFRSSSSASSGCGRPSIPAGSARSMRCMSRSGRDVRLVMASQDVIHSFYVPALRVKHDVVPGRYESLWFRADRPGTLPLLLRRILRHRPRAYGRVADGDGAARLCRLASRERRRRSARRAGRERCSEATAAAAATSPAERCARRRSQGLYGSPVPLSDGRVIRADEGYIRDSILLPKTGRRRRL